MAIESSHRSNWWYWKRKPSVNPSSGSSRERNAHQDLINVQIKINQIDLTDELNDRSITYQLPRHLSAWGDREMMLKWDYINRMPLVRENGESQNPYEPEESWWTGLKQRWSPERNPARRRSLSLKLRWVDNSPIMTNRNWNIIEHPDHSSVHFDVKIEQ